MAAFSQHLTRRLASLRTPNLPGRGWFNAVWFQTVWFTCVLGGAALVPLAVALLAAHFLLVPSTERELRTVLPLAGLGIALDALLSAAGVFSFDEALLPLWLGLLWVAFAASLHRAFGFLAAHPLRAGLVGGVAVPLNYLVGARLGAVSLPLGDGVTLVILMGIWAVFLPLLYRIAPYRGAGA